MTHDSNDRSWNFRDNIDNFLNHVQTSFYDDCKHTLDNDNDGSFLNNFDGVYPSKEYNCRNTNNNITNKSQSSYTYNNIMAPKSTPCQLPAWSGVTVQPSVQKIIPLSKIITHSQSTQLAQTDIPPIDLDLNFIQKGSVNDTLRKKHRNRKNHHINRNLNHSIHNLDDNNKENNESVNTIVDIITTPNTEHDLSLIDLPKKVEIINIESDINDDIIIFNVKQVSDILEASMSNHYRNASEAIEEMKQILEKFINIKDRFVVLSNLKEGYKIWITIDPVTENPSFEIDDSYFPALARRWNGSQSRENTINIIVNDTNYIAKNLKKLPENDQNRKKMSLVISAVIPGIINLSKTYAREKTHADALISVIGVLKKYAYAQKEEKD
jgi:hypothetical protein